MPYFSTFHSFGSPICSTRVALRSIAPRDDFTLKPVNPVYGLDIAPCSWLCAWRAIQLLKDSKDYENLQKEYDLIKEENQFLNCEITLAEEQIRELEKVLQMVCIEWLRFVDTVFRHVCFCLWMLLLLGS